MRMPAARDVDVAVALGLLIVAAIEHLTARDSCCPSCCPSCAALDFYQDSEPLVADVAVGKALGGQRASWQLDDDTINWPYLIQFWITDPDHQCAS